MQPLQYDLGCPAAKDNSITLTVAAPSKLDAAIPMRSAENELQNTIELCAAASEIAAPKQISATVEDVKTKLSCEISLKIWKPKMWKQSFRAAFVRDFHPNLNLEDVKTTLACETSLSFWKLKLWKWRRNCQVHCHCGADPTMIRPSTVRRTSFSTHLPRHVLSCKTQHFVHSLKNAFRARLPSKS